MSINKKSIKMHSCCQNFWKILQSSKSFQKQLEDFGPIIFICTLIIDCFTTWKLLLQTDIKHQSDCPLFKSSKIQWDIYIQFEKNINLNFFLHVLFLHNKRNTSTGHLEQKNCLSLWNLWVYQTLLGFVLSSLFFGGNVLLNILLKKGHRTLWPKDIELPCDIIFFRIKYQVEDHVI